MAATWNPDPPSRSVTLFELYVDKYAYKLVGVSVAVLWVVMMVAGVRGVIGKW